MTKDEIMKIAEALINEGNSLEDTSAVSIMVETGEDEALMLGTKASFLRLAGKVLMASYREHSDPPKFLNVDGTKLIASNEIEEAFDKLAHVVPRTVCTARDEKDLKLAVSYFQNRG